MEKKTKRTDFSYNIIEFIVFLVYCLVVYGLKIEVKEVKKENLSCRNSNTVNDKINQRRTVKEKIKRKDNNK